ncbi:MAG TPA: hypothetical protein P5102_13670 [Candidatus Competibacteraceae bacterium]|nr:hypothetical protein [Candidatus Competibacteraceae bacterium]HRZ07170.1 hypothetical protein [Candidatus Competibacteraceae bacterium]
MSLSQTIIISLKALISALMSAFLTNYLQRRNEQIKFSRDKLFDRYSEFVAVASADLFRARMQLALAERKFQEENKDLIDNAYQSMKSNKMELSRLSLQIRLLESDEQLKRKVQQIEKSQPFMFFLFPPKSDSDYQGKLNKFDSDINLFEQSFFDLANMVLANQKIAGKCLLCRYFCR